MARVLTHSSWYHVPKTGGMSIRAGLIRSMGTNVEIGWQHSTPADTPHILEHKPPFLFVREPATWYHSMWAFRMYQDWIQPYGTSLTPLHEVASLDKLRKMCFEEYMELVEVKAHGYCTSMFFMFTDCPYVEHIGKQENLINDLIKFLKEFDEPFNEKLLLSQHKLNVSTRQPRISKRTRKLIRKMDGKIYDRFEYA